MPPGVRGGRTGRRCKRAAAPGERRERLCALSGAPALQPARQNQEREPLDEGLGRLVSLADALPSRLARLEETLERPGMISGPPDVLAGHLSAFFGRRSSRIGRRSLRFGRLHPFPARLSLDRIVREGQESVPRVASTCASHTTTRPAKHQATPGRSEEKDRRRWLASGARRRASRPPAGGQSRRAAGTPRLSTAARSPAPSKA